MKIENKINNTPNSILLRGSLGGLLVNVCGLALAFFLQIYLARNMALSEFGAYVYVISWMSILVLFSSFGLEGVAFRYVAAYVATNELSKLKGLVLRSFQIILLISTGVILAVGAFFYFSPGLIVNHLAALMILGSLLLPFWAMAMFCQTTLASLKKTVKARFSDIVFRPGVMLIVAYCLAMTTGRELSARVALTIHLLSLGISLLLAVYFLRASLKTMLKGVTPEYQTSEWLTTARSLMLIGLIYITLNQFDAVMIGIFRNVSEVGVYSVAVRISQFVTFFLQAAYLIAAPLISELYASKDHANLWIFVRKLTHGLILTALPIFLIIIFSGEFILGIFGGSFTTGYWVLLLLAFSQLSNALVGPVGYLLTMSGNEKEVLNIVSRALLINIVLNIPLIYFYGVIGAAVATCFATICSNIMMARKVRTLLGYTYFYNSTGLKD